MDTTIETGARVRLLRCYLLDTRCELLRLLREPMYIIPTLLFPALFYVMFGLLLGGRGSGEAARYLLATYGVFGAMGAGLFGASGIEPGGQRCHIQRGQQLAGLHHIAFAHQYLLQ